MPYKICITLEGDGKPIRHDYKNRRTALTFVEGLATSPGIFGGQDVEVIGLKGERILDSSIKDGDTHYLAWRDDRRISIEGYPSEEEAEAARRELRAGLDSTVRPVRTSLEWIEEAAKAGPGRTGFEPGVRTG